MSLQEDVDKIPTLAQEPVENVDRLIEAVIRRESSGNPNAVSPAGARGLMQIMPVVLKEYNTFNKANYTIEDLFNPEINKNIGSWYLNDRIPQMLKYYKIPNTVENRLHAYNAGIGNLLKGIKPKETANYINRIVGDLK